MEYHKIAKLLDNNLSSQSPKFRTKNWVKTNDESKESYSSNSDIRFKTKMLKSNLIDQADAYILVKGSKTITGAGANDSAKQLDERNEGVILKNCALFTKCISRINGTNNDNAQDIGIAMPMNNLTEYSNNYYSKTFGSLWQYYKDDPNDDLVRSESFRYKIKITGKNPTAGNTKMLK